MTDSSGGTAPEIPEMFRRSRYAYRLPSELIAQHPLPDRSASRLMRVERRTGRISHHRFHEFPEILPPDTLVVVNNTRVIPARLRVRLRGGGRGEILLLRREGGTWRALARPARRIRPGETYSCGNTLSVHVEENLGRGEKRVRLIPAGVSEEEALEREGETPLPPYIKRTSPSPEDRERYQTVYASRRGSAAAPTAGLHFTQDVLARLRERGIPVKEITLHVGSATFLPVRTEDIRKHTMHAERFLVPGEVLEEMKTRRRRILAVGTTTLRALETAVRADAPAEGPLEGETALFIYPGFTFEAVDMLLTNFHLPESTLLMLVCAFAGRELVFRAYEEAIRKKYRFYSYGDCMLIV